MTLASAISAAMKVAAAQAAVDTLGTACDSGTLKFYTGTAPANAGAITTQTLLGTCTFGATAFGSGTAENPSVATANAITQDASADASGTVGFVRVLDGSTVLGDLTVGLAESGAEVIMDSLDVTAGSPISIASCTISQTIA